MYPSANKWYHYRQNQIMRALSPAHLKGISMVISIRKVFLNLKLALFILGIGGGILLVELFQISHYTERLSALKNQHLLIDKTINTDLSDPKMAYILINGSLSELALSVKLSGEEGWIDSFAASNEEQASLLRSLTVSSQAFRDSAMIWSESLLISRYSQHERMMNARSALLGDIDRMIDYQIHTITGSIATAKITALLVFGLSLMVFLVYQNRLNQIYRDIDQACSVDTDGSKKEILTQEIDFILKKLRRGSQNTLNPNLTNPMSGLSNEKGLINLFNTKKSGKSGSTIFLSLFEIDHYTSLVNTRTKEDMGTMFKKIGEIISMYEQPFDVVAHIENNHFVFLMSRNSKDSAYKEAEKIIHSVQESSFVTSQGPMKITLSGGFLLKPPSKSVDDTVQEAIQLIEKAKELGGNRVAQMRN
jgi:GGDEF domain-containing protein